MGGESFTENMGNMKLDDEQHSETTENGYVDVNGDERKHPSSELYLYEICQRNLPVPPSSSSSDMVSISVAEKWEKELLEDPKVSTNPLTLKLFDIWEITLIYSPIRIASHFPHSQPMTPKLS